MFKVLYVEDDVSSAKIVAKFLENRGVSVDHVTNGKNIAYHVIKSAPDCILLDICLPGPSGYDLVRSIREIYSGYIMFITSTASEKIEIISLKLGVDDFISKSSSLDLLFARITRFFNKDKGTQTANNSVVKVGKLEVDKNGLVCLWRGHQVNLTKDELDALFYFMLRKDCVISREELFMALNGVPFDGISRGMDIKVSRIREKLECAGIGKNVLSTRRGSGYMFNSQIVLASDVSSPMTLSEKELDYINSVVK